LQLLAISFANWPYLIAAVALTLPLLCERWYRRRMRQFLTFGIDDPIAAVQVIGALRQSWTPFAFLVRILRPGTLELRLANRFNTLQEHQSALEEADRGLKTARSRVTRAALLAASAEAAAALNQVALMEVRLAELSAILDEQPIPSISHPWISAHCYRRAGRLDKSFEILHQELSRAEKPAFQNASSITASVLLHIGRFDDALELAEKELAAQEHDEPNPNVRSAAIDPSGSVKLLQQHARRAADFATAVAGLEAARRAGRWDRFESLLSAIPRLADGSPISQACIVGLRSLLAAHRSDTAAYQRCKDQLDQIIDEYPDDRRLHAVRAGMIADALQIGGKHEQALQLLTDPATQQTAPISRSERANDIANSLDALGRHDEAKRLRDDASRLAPLAYWNRPPDRYQIVPPPYDAPLGIQPAVHASPGPPNAISSPVVSPIAPVASPPAYVVWILACAAMFPVLGILPALALAVVAAVLLLKREPLAHDRRAGWIGLLAALASIAIGATTIGLSLSARADIRRQLSRWNATESRNAETGPADAAQDQDPDDDAMLDSAPSGTQPSTTSVPSDESTPATGNETKSPHAPSFELSLRQKVALLAILLISIMLHEIGHAIAACWAGDPTGRDDGRFSLNPLRHIDPIGSILVPAALAMLRAGAVIGWAKPVRFRLDRLRHPRSGHLAISLAGVSANLILAEFAASALALLQSWAIYRKGLLGMYILNLHKPLTFHDAFLDEPIWNAASHACIGIILVNTVLVGFNLLPIPPLDGFNAISAIAPRFMKGALAKLRVAGVPVLLVLIAIGALERLLIPAVLFGVVLLAIAWNICQAIVQFGI